jgi:hypothetical protein
MSNDDCSCIAKKKQLYKKTNNDHLAVIWETCDLVIQG